MSRIPKVAVVIYTFNRPDDARVNQEIIRTKWQEVDALRDVKIVHAFNGDKQWWQRKHLEDRLVRRPNPGHFAGAADLIDAGFAAIAKSFPDTDYVVVLAADTWIVKPTWLAEVIDEMKSRSQVLAASAWGHPGHNDPLDVGMGGDLFIVDYKKATSSGLLPLAYDEFFERHGEFMMYSGGWAPSFERLLALRFKQSLMNLVSDDVGPWRHVDDHLRVIIERHPVHTGRNAAGFMIRKWQVASMGLISNHSPGPKRTALRRVAGAKGPTIGRMLDGSSLRWFNDLGADAQRPRSSWD